MSIKEKVNKFTEKLDKEVGYKPSRFNVRTKDKNGNLLILNTYSNQFLRIDLEDTENVIKTLNKPNANLDQPYLSEFVKRGIIIPSTIDEFRRAEYLHQETLTLGGGLELTIMPNEDCNFRCKYCYESFAKNFMSESVQKGIIKFLEKNLHRYKFLNVSWFGGEPLTAIPIIEDLSRQMIDLCKKNRIPYAAGMTTNGYNLNLDVFKKMQKCRVRKYQITIDGTAETHDKQRVQINGDSTFEQIVKNLKDIKENIKSHSFHIMIRSNITGPVLHNIDKYIEFLKKEFSGDIRFSSFWQAAGNWGGDSVKQIESTFCNTTDYLSALGDASDEGISFNMYRDMMKPTGSVCYASKKNSFVIGSDGIIYKCTVAFDMEENQVGMLSENGIMHIDHDKHSLWVAGHESIDPTCQKCYFRPACQGATCPLERMKIDTQPCPDVKKSIKEYMRILAKDDNQIEDLRM
ncbi:radical SAM/SPASM domain-containing protein [Sutcliffiella rhizosphaerae]|uniref:GTP 3',8-cyclase n=1 Tax=Sutcliffiella rhizosphaerae TaxID=2880967 RepID=A0ABM8YUN9_9BACI|nr:radical SAM protein [Sutcliffiella rhizosphaerae]CAG9623699.1 GTP 3',8-cyclase [Sutcliffiella rhizosphaerae]